jgi:hypothetical protein
VSDRYFVRLRGQVRGPFSRDQLCDELTHGRFGVAYEVSTNRVQWQSGRELATQLQKESSLSRSTLVEKTDSLAVSEIASHQVAKNESAARPPAINRAERPPKRAQWYWTLQGRHTDEFCGALDDLHQQISNGRLMPNEFVRNGDGEDWRRADTVPELAGLWDTVLLQRLSRFSAALGATSFLVCLVSLTIFVARWSSQSGVSDPMLWMIIGLGNALALITGGLSRFAYIEWLDTGSPRSPELLWLETGVVCSAGAIIPSILLTVAFLLSSLLYSRGTDRPSQIDTSASQSRTITTARSPHFAVRDRPRPSQRQTFCRFLKPKPRLNLVKRTASFQS